MHDDDAMDRLLRHTLTGEVPRLSSAFDDRVMRSVRPRRLTAASRAVMATYAVVAVAAAAWVMRDVPVAWIAAAIVAGIPAATGAGAYARRLAPRAHPSSGTTAFGR